MRFHLAEHGTVFSTRPRGRKLRQELLSQLTEQEHLTLSLDGVVNLSYSFADEFVAATVADLGLERVDLVNVSESLRDVIHSSVNRRGIAVSEADLFDLVAA